MKKVWCIIGLISLLMLMAIPASADFSASLDLTGGNAGSEYFSSGKQTESSNLSGFNLGLGYDYQNWLFGLDYTAASLNDNVGGSKSFSLGDYWAGYRFYEKDAISAMAILSYNNESSGHFSASGWTAGLGAKFLMDPGWSMEGRLGYSLLGGVSVKNSPDEYQSPSLWTYALKINYQISDAWSAHIGTRHYGFSGNSNGQSLKSDTNLYFAGVTYRFNMNSAKPNPSQAPDQTPKPNPEPKPQPSPEPTPVQQPEPNSPKQSEPAPKPEPATEVKSPEPAETPEVTNPVAEKIEQVNNVLQPIFFDFDKATIRANQIPILQKDLEILNANPDMYILIGGHADHFGTSLYNLKLSSRRANVVKQWLLKHGIDPKRISIAAYGSKYPYKAKSNDPKWESDRWVDIFVTDDPPTEETGIRK